MEMEPDWGKLAMWQVKLTPFCFFVFFFLFFGLGEIDNLFRCYVILLVNIKWNL
jgi:hypothetical protein